MLLTLLALGVFVSGLNVRSWKLCVTGAFLAVGVPMVAWVERAALLLLLIGIALVVVIRYIAISTATHCRTWITTMATRSPLGA